MGEGAARVGSRQLLGHFPPFRVTSHTITPASVRAARYPIGRPSVLLRPKSGCDAPRGQDLDRHLAAEAGVGGAIDRTDVPVTDLRDDVADAEAGAWSNGQVAGSIAVTVARRRSLPAHGLMATDSRRNRAVWPLAVQAKFLGYRRLFVDVMVGARGFEPPTPRSRTEAGWANRSRTPSKGLARKTSIRPTEASRPTMADHHRLPNAPCPVARAGAINVEHT